MRVIFRLADGEDVVVEHARVRDNLMQVALHNNVPGITGECGGLMACGTCHVRVEPCWLDVIGAASGEEREIIDLSTDPHPRSRLCCQVWLTRELDGLQVSVVAP